MFTNNDNYDLDSASNKIANMEMFMQISIELEAVEQLLIQKGIFTESDLDATMNYIKSTPQMKETIERIEGYKQSIKYYKENPEDHLKAILNAKLRGEIQ